MTPERLRKILDALGWNATALARRLGMARERSATEWLNGRRPIPQPVADWLELMYRHVGAVWWLNGGGQPVRRFLAPVLGTLASIGIALDGESMPPLVRAGVLIVVAGCAIYLWWLVIRD